MPDNRPNIVYLHSHDTGRYIQPYGYAVPTPNLQRLAEEGVLFRQAFCCSPTCSPSRACLLTGQTAHNNGMLGLSHMGFSLHDYGQHLVQILKQAGYYCALSGIQHEDGPEENLSLYGSRIGYDAYLDREDMQSVWDHAMAETRAAEFLRNAPQHPFFLSVGFGETHRTFPDPDDEQDAKYCRPPAPIPDTPETRQEMAGYISLARTLDRKMGIILTALAESGLSENTLVICTTDHGIAYPRMKCNLTDHGMGVMLVLRGPGGFHGGKIIDGMVSHLDIFPTLCELLNLKCPAWLQGQSIMPLVRGEVEEIHDAVFGEINFHAAYEPQRAVRTQRWKYIRHYNVIPSSRTLLYEMSIRRWKCIRRQGNTYALPMIANCDAGPSRDLYLEHDWQKGEVACEQLYDLMLDPNEMRNLAGDYTHYDVLIDMRARLESWMLDTNDTFSPMFAHAADTCPLPEAAPEDCGLRCRVYPCRLVPPLRPQHPRPVR